MRLLQSRRLLLVAVLLLCQACRKNEPELPTILLISFDTFRADAIDSSLTPALARFAEDSITFEKAFVPYPHTLTSHMTLLTGVYPDVHRVFPKGQRLPATISTMATLLKSAGYRTIGVVTTEWLKPDFGFARGFDHYQLLPHKPTYADRVNAEALRHLEKSRGESGPTFLFLHYYDAHSDFEQGGANKLPYYSPPRYREHLELKDDEFCDDQGLCSTRYLMAMDKGRVVLSQDHIEKIFELYRSGIHALDDEMGAFFEELKRRELYDDSLIIVTSDHGEEFREHGRFIHSQPYDETISVPLLIKFPHNRMAGVTFSDPVESLDVLPTLLDHLAIERPAYLQGQNLITLISQAAETGKPVFSQDSIALHRYSLRTSEFKFIANLKHGRAELYDLDADPEERVNIAAERSDLAEHLQQELIARVRANRALGRELDAEATATDELFTQEERDNLKALGYLN